jgi:hypothetical protein
MTIARERCCAICLEARVQETGWFLLTENRWTDRLKILAWDDSLAVQPGIYAACGAEHVRQLVIHWMAMSTLDFPFARAYSQKKKLYQRNSTSEQACDTEPDTRGVTVLGELSVHRESLERILNESPQLLGCILLALVDALGGPKSSLLALREEEAAHALT